MRELRHLFSRFGAPKLLRTDEDTVFCSADCQEMLEDWGVRHVTSAPHRHDSNGHAESAGVKRAKWILKHHKFGSDEFHKAIVAWRNRELVSRGETPAKVLFGRPIRAGQWQDVTVQKELPEPSKRATAKLSELLEKDCGKVTRATEHSFKVGDYVMVQDPDIVGSRKEWRKSGRLVKQEGQRKFEVSFEDEGRNVVRNVKHLKADPRKRDSSGDLIAEAARDGHFPPIPRPVEAPQAEKMKKEVFSFLQPHQLRNRSGKAKGAVPTRKSPRSN